MTEDLDPEEFLCSYYPDRSYLVTTHRTEAPLTSDLPYEFEYIHHPKRTIHRITRSTGGIYVPTTLTIGKVTMATELAAAEAAKKKERSLEEMVPPYLHDLLPVFDKCTASTPGTHCV